MKSCLQRLITIFALAFVFSGCGDKPTANNDVYVPSDDAASVTATASFVTNPGMMLGGHSYYICTTGEVYHLRRNCRGLNTATHPIIAVSDDITEQRRPCKICAKGDYYRFERNNEGRF